MVATFSDFKMEKRHVQTLFEFEQELKTNLNISCLLSKLVNQALLTDEEEATLMLPDQSDLEKNSKFLSILITKGYREFIKFLQALNEEHQPLGHKDLYWKLLTADKNHLNTVPTEKLLQPKVAREDTSKVLKNESETIAPRHNTPSPASLNSDIDMRHTEKTVEWLHFVFKEHFQLMDTKLQNLEESFRGWMSSLEIRVGRLEAEVSKINMRPCTRTSLGYGCVICSFSGSVESLDRESMAPEDEQQDVNDSGRSSPESCDADAYPAYKKTMNNYSHRHMRVGTKHMSLRPRQKFNSKNSTF